MWPQLGYVNRGKPASVRGRPFDTRIGGLPAYYEGDARPSPHCDHCGRPLFLVAQIYAPVETTERSLYVFACNAQGCNTAQGGSSAVAPWRVYRSQQPQQSQPGSSDGTAIADAPPAAGSGAAAALTVPTTDAWGAAGAWDTTEDADGGSSSGEFGAPLSMAELSATLVSSTDASVCSDAAAAAAPVALPHPYFFPAFDVTTCDEPEGDDADGGSSDSDNDGGAGHATAAAAAASSRSRIGGSSVPDVAADAHARKLLAEYTAWESTGGGGGDTTDAPSLPPRGGGGGGGGAEDGSDDDDDDDDYDDEGEESSGVGDFGRATGGTRLGGGGGGRGDLDRQAHPKDVRRGGGPPGDRRAGKDRRRNGGGSGSGGSAGGGGGGGGGIEKYERVPARTRTALHYQYRLDRLPTQCMRYAWGTEPLWPVPAADAAIALARQRNGGAAGGGGGVPPCAACGAPRVFEAQLTPHLLYVLRVEELTAETIEARDGIEAPPRPTATASSNDVSAAAGAAGCRPSTTVSAPAGPSSSAVVGAASAAAAAAARATASAFNSLDFATVLVYSCPDSCAGGAEEVAVAIPYVGASTSGDIGGATGGKKGAGGRR